MYQRFQVIHIINQLAQDWRLTVINGLDAVRRGWKRVPLIPHEHLALHQRILNHLRTLPTPAELDQSSATALPGDTHQARLASDNAFKRL